MLDHACVDRYRRRQCLWKGTLINGKCLSSSRLGSFTARLLLSIHLRMILNKCKNGKCVWIFQSPWFYIFSSQFRAIYAVIRAMLRVYFCTCSVAVSILGGRGRPHRKCAQMCWLSPRPIHVFRGILAEETLMRLFLHQGSEYLKFFYNAE